MFLLSWDWELWRLSRLLASLLDPLRNASLLVALVFTAAEAGQPEAWTLFLGELLFNLVALLVVTWLIGEVGVALAVAIDEWRRALAPGSDSIPECLRDATTSGHPRSHSGIESTRPHDADGARSGRGKQQRIKDAEAPDTRYEGSPGALTRRKDTAMHYTRIRSLVERLRGPRAIALLAIHALTPTTGQGVWSSAQAAPRGTIGTLHWPSPILVNGQLIVVDHSGQFTAYALPLHSWKATSS